MKQLMGMMLVLTTFMTVVLISMNNLLYMINEGVNGYLADPNVRTTGGINSIKSAANAIKNQCYRCNRGQPA